MMQKVTSIGHKENNSFELIDVSIWQVIYPVVICGPNLISQEHIDSLQEKITRQACLSKAYAFLDEIRLADKWNELKLDDSTCSVSFNAPLINRLHEIVLPNSFERLAKDWKMIDLQPSFMKVPCKPFLFDIASEELSFPDMSLFVNEGNKSVEDTNAKKGLLGRAVSWFSGKK
ncbi:Signal recognition particle subunit SRP68 [Galdieria sulphuraria]|nr:Signal recognition particle subunit SRP68 [Galdieria sulphuraria]